VEQGLDSKLMTSHFFVWILEFCNQPLLIVFSCLMKILKIYLKILIQNFESEVKEPA
jgi:hypothetical protein